MGSYIKGKQKKIDKIIIEAAKTVTEKDTTGRTNKWILKELKWLNIEEIYENKMQVNIYKMINFNKDHYMSHYLTKNRNIRNRKQNKVGHHDQ